MKTITIPKNIEVKAYHKDKPEELIDQTVSFKEYLISNPLNSLEFGASFLTLTHREEILTALSNLKPGNKLTMSDEAFSTLHQVTCFPSKPYTPDVASQIYSFLAAINLPSMPTKSKK